MHNTVLTTDVEATIRTPAPYARPRYTLIMALRQYKILLLTQLSSYRQEWIFHVFMGIVLPISLVFFARSMGTSLHKEDAIFLLGGNMAMSIAFGPTAFLINKLGWARQSHEFEYWIALPLPKIALIISIISVSLLFSLPGLLGSYVLGTLLLGLPFSGSWLLLFLVPISVLSLAGVGALLGSIAPSGQSAGMVSNLLITFTGFLSPMLIRPEQLPDFLRAISWFIPTTYIADAFRTALGTQNINVVFGTIRTNIVLDIVILALFTLITLIIAHVRIDWRIK